MGLRGTLAVLLLAVSGLDAAVSRVPSVICDESNENNATIFDFSHPDIWDTRNISLSDYAGQFGGQEPGANATEILNGVRWVRPGSDFVPNFQMFLKTDVNGDNEIPLYTFLKSQCPSTRDGHSAKDELLYNPLKNTDIRWNFEKFLITKRGQPYKRYDPSFDPFQIEPDIQALLDMPDEQPRYHVTPKRSKIDYKPVVKPMPKPLPSRSSQSSQSKSLPVAAVIWTASTLLLLTK